MESSTKRLSEDSVKSPNIEPSHHHIRGCDGSMLGLLTESSDNLLVELSIAP